MRVDFKDGAQSIFVVGGVFAPLNFVIGNRCLAEVWLFRRAKVNVNVHANFDTALVLHLGHVLNVSLALSTIEVSGRKG